VKAVVNRRSCMLPAFRHNQMSRDVVILWHEGDWHCELRPSSIPGEARLLVCFRKRVVTAESVNTGMAVQTRAEILRLRVVRGHLRAPD
jgi:hypothetical protein